jgi:hypothetical protein
MRYYFDTEFHEDGVTIDLISIGIVDDNNREYYAISKEADYDKTFDDEWLRKNVMLPIYKELEPERQKNPFSLQHFKTLVAKHGKTRKQIKDEIMEFIGDDESPMFMANHASYDWVAFCQLFGQMMSLPEKFPRYCQDLKQTFDELGLDKKWENKYCPEPKDIHNALADARWNKTYYEQLEIERKRQK